MNPFHGINEEFNPQFAVEPATNTRRLAIRCIEADLVDGMFALPGQLFYGTQIPDCLWFLAKNNAADAKRGSRDRRVQTLILGTLIDRV
ncbi:MAG TPA: hypothetical protein DEP46_07830, partial [Blastocatellia bacterium]|nr:hypothetical protein [Blastocatellia bacterium]